MLSDKRATFVNEYLIDFNATQAAIRAGYSERSARSQGNRLLTNADIQAEIRQRISEKAMTADEVLLRLADMARGDMGDFLEITSLGFTIDLSKAKEKGLTHLIRKVKQKTTTFLGKSESDEDRETTETEIELYDAQAALVQLGRYHALFTDKADVTSDGEKIIVTLKQAEGS